MPVSVTHLVVLLVISWIYLTLVRFVDLNEREPVWSLALAFVLGCVAAGLVALLINPVTLVLSPWTGAAAEEISKGLAYGACLLIFAAIARIKGWFELSDLVDGIVYGIAIGLGFSAGDAFLHDLAFAAYPFGDTVRLGPAIVNGALVGLSHGLFGGVTGLGVGLAVEAHGKVRRLVLPLLGLAAAIGLNGLFRLLAHGNALDGHATVYRAWIAVVLPLAGLVAVGLLGLSRERRTIARQLAPEIESGLVTGDDLALLRSFWVRQTQYMRLLAAGKIHQCLVAAGRHNRQVQLALAKARIEGEPDGAHVASLSRQIEALRRAVRHTAPVILIVLLLVPLTGALALRRQGTLPSAGVVRVLGIAVPSIDGYWRRQIVAYSTPNVAPYSTSSSVCPFQKNNAMFCHPDGNIYYDPAFLNELYDSIGDFAPVVVLAHEWGHKVQSLRGAMQNAAGQWTIVRELQADCYAGEWVRNVESGNGTNLEKGDLGEALEVLNQGRDPRGNPWYDPHAHGTGGQRVDAFQAGREGVACTSDSLWVEVHLDPAASQQTTVPASGSLIAETAKRKGRFTLVNIRPITNLVTPNRTEVVLAIYRAADGSEVQVARGAFTSPEGAGADLVADSTTYLGRGYHVTGQGQVKDGDAVIGRWVSLLGEKQIVMITNRQTYSFMIGPEGILWEFATAQAQ